MQRFLMIGLALFMAAGCSSGSNSQVVMETSMGPVKIELFQDKAPITVKNFLDYVDDKFYDGTIFHRVIEDFMVQGGGMTPDMTEKPARRPIRNESSNGLRNERGTLAMARTNDPDSASSQFFINVKDNAFLDKANAPDRYGYAVFGRVVEGMDVVDKIRAVRTGARRRACRTRAHQVDTPGWPPERREVKLPRFPKGDRYATRACRGVCAPSRQPRVAGAASRETAGQRPRFPADQSGSGTPGPNHHRPRRAGVCHRL